MRWADRWDAVLASASGRYEQQHLLQQRYLAFGGCVVLAAAVCAAAFTVRPLLGRGWRCGGGDGSGGDDLTGSSAHEHELVVT